MKKLFSILLLAFVISTGSQTVFAQGFPYHLYNPRTLAELKDINDKAMPKIVKDKTNISISAKPFYSAIRLEFTGQSRKIPKPKLGLFKIWEESLNVGSDRRGVTLFDLLDKEFLFVECSKEYWIPVQNRAANDFPKDLKKGDMITLYMMLVGGIEKDEKWEYVYFTNSFRVY